MMMRQLVRITYKFARRGNAMFANGEGYGARSTKQVFFTSHSASPGPSQTTVHELTHCLWERLGGRFLRPSRQADSRIHDHKLAVEGYAVYGERIWFRDSYPLWLRQRLASERLDEAIDYTMGMRAIEKLVDKWGEWILLKVPRDWQKLLKTISTGEG
jgi:hypothetical protein